MCAGGGVRVARRSQAWPHRSPARDQMPWPKCCGILTQQLRLWGLARMVIPSVPGSGGLNARAFIVRSLEKEERTPQMEGVVTSVFGKRRDLSEVTFPRRGRAGGGGALPRGLCFLLSVWPPFEAQSSCTEDSQAGPDPDRSAQRQRLCLKPQRGNQWWAAGLPD